MAENDALTEEEIAAGRALDPQSYEDGELIVKLWPRILVTLAERTQERDDAQWAFDQAARHRDSVHSNLFDCRKRAELAERERDALREALEIAEIYVRIASNRAHDGQGDGTGLAHRHHGIVRAALAPRLPVKEE